MMAHRLPGLFTGMQCAVALPVLLSGALAASAALAAPPAEEPAAAEVVEQAVLELYRDQPQALRGNQACIVIVGNGGTLAANPEATELSSMGFGGAPGTAEIIATNSSYVLTAEAPDGFVTAPNEGSDAISFQATFSGNGDTNFSETPGHVPVRVKRGQTSIRANLIATRTVGSFPAGQYRAEITLRCE